MGYAEENLTPNETLLYKARISWVIYLPGFLFMCASPIFRQYIPVALAVFGVGILMMLRAYFYAISTEFAVTNERIIAKTGLVSRNTMEVRHDKVEGLVLDQSVWGRMLNYGTLILHGTGSGSLPIRNIDNPLEFRRAALEAIDQYGSRS